jgi:hypothetical protein
MAHIAIVDAAAGADFVIDDVDGGYRRELLPA